jgi:hypothetical protein
LVASSVLTTTALAPAGTAVVLSTRDSEVNLNVVIASFKRRRVEYAQASMHSRTSAFVDLDVDQLLGVNVAYPL